MAHSAESASQSSLLDKVRRLVQTPQPQSILSPANQLALPNDGPVLLGPGEGRSALAEDVLDAELRPAALQHVVGMRRADTIVAVNRDDDAPIFRFAHYGVVGDVADVLPKLSEVLRHRTEDRWPGKTRRN